jgi:sugar phosphate isomerase/epimerase
MDRREFLIGTVAAAAALGTRRVRAQTPDRAKLDRVAIMTYSFDRIIKVAGRAEDPARTLEFFDVPEMFADKYQVHNVEVQHNHFGSTESSFFKDFRARLAKAKSRVTNINLEFGNMSITAADPVMRAQAVDLTKQWIDHAIELGSPRVMVNQGSPTPENRQVAIETLKIMGDYGKSKKIMVSMEPRGGGGGGRNAGAAAGGQTTPPPAAPAGPPPPPAYILLTEIIKGSGTYANVDIGNFGEQETQHAGMRAMFPFTVGNTHIKMNPARYDLPAALALMRELKYTGLYSIEAGGQGDPYENVQRIYEALVQHL